MLDTIKIGLIGVGNFGSKWKSTLESLGVLGMTCDLTNPADTRDYHELLKSNVNAVVIATPPETHFKIAKDALMAGKDVLVEKPMTVNSIDAYNLIELAKKREKILMVGHIMLHNDGFKKFKEEVETLARVSYIQARRLEMKPLKENPIWQLAIHDLYMIISLLGRPSHAKAFKDSKSAVVRISFPQNYGAGIFVSYNSPYQERTFSVIGSEKVVVFNELQNTSNALMNEANHFIECIKNRTKPITDGEQALYTIKILENL